MKNMAQGTTGMWRAADGALPAVTDAARLMTIQSLAGRRLTAIAADGSCVHARRAVSCLVTPIPGDLVLTTQAGGQTYILAVLERASDGEALPLRIETEGDLDFVARRISFRAGFLDILADAVTMVGDAFNSLFRLNKRVVGSDTVIAKRTTLHTGERVSVVAQADVHHAGLFSQTVDGPIAINSETAVVSAKADIRINGERINMG